MPTSISNDVTIPDKDAVEPSRALEQGDPTVSTIDNHISDLKNQFLKDIKTISEKFCSRTAEQFLNPNIEIRRRTGALTNEGNIGSIEENSQPNEDGQDSTGDAVQTDEEIVREVTGKALNLTLNPNGEIRRLTDALINEYGIDSNVENSETNEEGQDSTGDVVQTNEDEFKILTGKEMLWHSMCYIPFLSVPLLAIIFGFLYDEKCPANSSIPCMVYKIGLVHFVLMYFDIQKKNQTEQKRISILFMVFILLWLYEVFFFILMDSSFDPSADNYCDPWFYYFTIFMNVIIIVGYILSPIVL